MTLHPNEFNSNIVDTRASHLTTDKRRIFVGLDFGTSTTKAMYRPVERDARVQSLDFGHGNRRFPSYAMPSSIRLDPEKKLFFGVDAEDGPGVVFRSFKVCVACQTGAIACRGCNGKSDHAQWRGRYDNGLSGFIPAHELMIYYLAWISKEVETIIRRKTSKFIDPELQYNLGVPISHLDSAPGLVDRFECILHHALALCGRFHQGISLDQARSLLIDALPDAVLPASEQRLHRALPETAAAAMWLQQAGVEKGITATSYLLIDIGAGTTDITIYRYDDANPDNLPIYAAKSVSIAGDDIDWSILKWFAHEFGISIERPSQVSAKLRQEVRRKKELLPTPDKSMEAIFGHRTSALNEENFVKKVVTPHAESIFKTASDAFSAAYKLAPRESQFPRLDIVMLGGGSKVTGIEPHFKRHKLRPFMVNMRQDVIEVQIPRGMEQFGANDFRMLAVAYGLSFPPAEFPKHRSSGDISPLQPNRSAPPPAYDDNPLLTN